MRDGDVEVLRVFQNGGGLLEDGVRVGGAEGRVGEAVLGFFEEFVDVFLGLHGKCSLISIAVHP